MLNAQLAIAEPQKKIHTLWKDISVKMNYLNRHLSALNDTAVLVVAISSVHNLYPVISCLAGSKFKTYFFETSDETEYKKIGYIDPSLIITDIRSSHFQNRNVLDLNSHDEQKNVSAAIEKIAVNPEFQAVICPVGKTSIAVNGALLGEALGQLDKVYKRSANSTILFSENISFPEKILDILWGATRNVSLVCVADLKSTGPGRYVYSTDEFAIDFGLFFFGGETVSGNNGKYKLLMDAARFADENGFSAVWTPERHFNEFGGLFPNPSVLSASLAMITKNVQLRAGSIVSPLHNAIRIAEEWSLVDNLSNGRAGLSFGSGWQCDDFVLAPDNYKVRHELMLEQIKTVKDLWQGKKVEQVNGLGKTVDIAIFPKPVNKQLPVWITVSGKMETFIDAGKLGANILTHLLWQDPSELIGKIQAYRESLAVNGFDPASGKVTVMVHTFLGNNLEEVKQLVKEPLKKYIRSSAFLIESMTKSNVSDQNRNVGGRYGAVDSTISEHQMEELLEIAFERFFAYSALLGTPDTARRLVKEIKSYGADEIACLIDFGVPDEKIMEGLDCLASFKESYSQNSIMRYNAGFLHCTADEFEALEKNAATGSYMDSFTGIIVDTTLFPISGKIPGNLSQLKFNHLNNNNKWLELPENNIKNTIMNKVTGTISEDF
jgi:natural product biosynthesis luciferase-like monooxygenase protein